MGRLVTEHRGPLPSLNPLDFGLLACRELVPDVWGLEGAFEASLEELVTAAKRVSGD